MKANEVLMIALKSYKEIRSVLESVVNTELTVDDEAMATIHRFAARDLVNAKYNLQRIITNCVEKTELKDRPEFRNFKSRLTNVDVGSNTHMEIYVFSSMAISMLEKIDLTNIESEEI